MALFGDMDYSEGFSIMPVLLHPRSRGALTLASKSPFDPPLIDPNFLADRQDIDILLEGISHFLITLKELTCK